MTVPSVAHAAGGNTGGASTSITVTLPDTPEADELTIIELVAPGTAVITPPAGWKRVPRCGGHSGTKGLSDGNNRLWAYYAIGDPGDTTPTFTSDTSLAFAWGVVIIADANMDHPFGSARSGNSSNTTGGGINPIQIPPTPVTDCMILSLIVAPAAGAAFTGGTWTEDVEQGNGSATFLYMIHNVTNFTAVDWDGETTTGYFFDWFGTGAGNMMQICICPATADFSIPQPGPSGLNSQTASTNTQPQIGVGAAGSGTTYFSDWLVPGNLVLAHEFSTDEAHTVSSVATANGGVALDNLDAGVFPYDNTIGAIQTSWYFVLLEEEDCYHFSNLLTLDYVKFTLSGSVTFQSSYWIVQAAKAPDPIGGYAVESIASSSNPDPAGFTVAEDDLILAFLGLATNTTCTNPSGYTAQQQLGGTGRSVFGYKRSTSSGTENPGTYTLGLAQVTTFLAIVVSSAGLPPPENTVAPAVTGTAIPPNVLTTDDGTWDYSPTSFTYQWQRSPNGVSGWSDITGETADTYELTAEDEEQYVRCVVTATNASGSTPANSNAVLIEEYPYLATFSMIG